MGLSAYSDHEILQSALNNIRNGSDMERSLHLVKSHVETALRELSLESFAQFENELYQQIFALVHSENVIEKRGGIRVMREIIKCPSASADQKAMQFANTLSLALSSSTDFLLLELIADALGYMARYAPVSHQESVENELTRALDWLRGSTPHRRLAACAVLHQLAENAPTIFFARCKEFFDRIWGPLRDVKEPIRQEAAKALSSCLSALVQRTYHLQWYCAVYEQVLLGFAQGTPEAVHGSLLVIAELLKHTGEFMIPRYKEICDGCLLLKDHRSKVVRSSLIHLIPRLSEYCPEAFVRSYLDDSIDILIRCMKTPELRGVALLAIGRLCRTMGSHLSYRVDELVAVVREALVGGGPSGSKKVREIPPEALKCVSDMVCGLGVSFHYRVLGLLDSMLQAGLTEELIEALAVIASNMPMHKEVVHQRLLTEIVKVLGVTLDSRDKKATTAAAPTPKSRMWPFRRNPSESTGSGAKDSPGVGGRGKSKATAGQRRKSFAFVPAPGWSETEANNGGGNISLAPMFGPQSSSITGREIPWKTASSSTLTIDQYLAKPTNYNADMVLLAMRTLRMLSTPSSGLLMLLHRYVLPFLHAKEEVVREEAASTAAKLVSPTAQSCGNRGPTADAVEMVLSKLLEVTITDNSQHVRMRVLKGVDKYFDRHLSQVHHINTLLYLTSDESFDIRYTAVELLGKLADKNPAVVLPNMRQVFKHLLAQLQTGSDVRLKEEAAYTICAFFRSVPLHRIVTPFVKTLIQTIPLEGDVRLVTASMEALGELCTVMRQHMIPHSDHLMPVIIMNLLDRSAKKKQEVAARTLGRLVSASGLVVAPYLQYPQLLPKTLELLSKGVASVPWSMRTEILRTLGLIGALDPRKYQHLLGHISDSSVGRDPNDITISKISRQGVGEWYLGEGTVRKYSEDAIRTQHMSSVITVKRWQRDRGGSMSLKDGDESEQKDALYSRHTDVLVRAAIQINGVEADGPAADMMYELTVMRAQSYPAGLEQPRLIPGSENYYPRVALTCLMNILRDPTLNMHHSAVTQSILYIFKFLEMQCVPYLEEIFPYLLQMFRKSSPGFRESLLHQFTKLASIAQYHLAPHLQSLFDIVIEYWNDHTNHLLQLVEAVTVHCHENIRPYVPQLLNKIMGSLVIPRDVPPRTVSATNLMDTNKSGVGGGSLSPAGTDDLSYVSSVKLKSVLKCICTMRGHLTPYLDLVIPSLCKFVQQLQELPVFPESIFGLTAHTLYLLSLKSALLDSPQVVSRAVHTLAKLMVFVQEKGAGKPGNAIYSYSIKFFCMAATQLGKQFLVFDHTLRETFAICGVECNEYLDIIYDIRMCKVMVTNRFLEKLQEDLDLTVFGSGKELKDQVTTLLPGLGIELISDMVTDTRDSFVLIADAAMYRGMGYGGNKHSAKHSTNPSTLQKAWDVSQRSTATDWNAWFGRFSVQLLMESPSPALRACAVLAQAYIPLARELFQAAFVSCWMELNEQYQEHLVRSLHIAFRSSSIPQEILLVLLNLAEFMEHDVDALPIDPRLLAELAERNHAYAKALHYRELEFRVSPVSCFDSLININKKLSLYDSAFGVLRMVQKMQDSQTGFGITVQEGWLATLGQWQEALEMYEKNLAADPTDCDSILGKVKCLNAVGKWEEALGLLSPNVDMIESAGTTVAMKASVIGARAAWSLNRWDVMDSFVQRLPANNMDSTFMKAVLAVHAEDYDTSAVYIDRTRKHLDETMTALLAESYSRAYMSFVMAQQLSELEEIIEYKLLLKQAGMSRRGSEASWGSSKSLVDMDNVASDNLATMTPGGNYRMRNAPGVGLSSIADETVDVNFYTTSRHMLAAEIGNRKAFIIDKWRKRIRGCLSVGKAAVSHWQRLINLRRMIAGEREDVDTWLDFTTLCRHSNNLSLAQRVIGLAVESNAAPTTVDNPFENFFPATPSMNPPMSPYRTATHAPSPIPLYMRRSNSAYGSHGNSLSMLDTAAISKGNSTIDVHALSVDCRIELEKLRLRWAMGQKAAAAEQLSRMTAQLSQYSQSSSAQSSVELANVHLKCLLKLGDWKVRLNTPGTVVDTETRMEIIQLYAQATSVNPNSYQAWHEWGLSNHHAVLEHSEQKSSSIASNETVHLLRRRLRRPSVPVENIRIFIVNALVGLFRAISLGTSKSCASIMQDMLCVLNFWFKYGEFQDVADVLQQGLQDAPLNSWLGVLPQLIARIHHPGDRARNLLHQLLGKLGTHHAQALMYPLSVALQSPRNDRKEAADTLLDSLREHSATLIDQSVLVSQELIRIAILWDEEWYATLEDSSRIYFGEGNVQGMLDMLLPLHEKIAQGPRSTSEINFCQTFGAELREAFLCLQNYLRIMAANNRPIPTSGAAPAPKSSQMPMSPEEAAIAGAWDFYIPIFKRIHQHKQITSLNLMNVSNELMRANNLDLAIPGTYTLHGEAVKIKAFRPHLIVIPSKQRPRKIRLLGHNGLEYVFLLKGHEDLRQDERAMQLFGLVNALLNYDRRTEDQDLAIQRYAVVPLSPLVGLVGWVPRCDTLHDLIRTYRDKKKILLDVEHRLMLNLAPNVKMYESLTHIQRLEVFEYALNNTSGEDLHKILWHNSVSSESWVIRRGMFTKSLAVMSVVGYVLGLGDRHPSNLMLEKSTCNVLHIDFGDCFEVAMHRDKFPEKIPFRLTRMLVMAMEVSGIEGTFRLTCERVMKVMRENRDSLIAVLEAFVHDPLISWRLLNPNKDLAIQGPESKQARGANSSSHKSPGDLSVSSNSDHPSQTSIGVEISEGKGLPSAPVPSRPIHMESQGTSVMEGPPSDAPPSRQVPTMEQFAAFLGPPPTIESDADITPPLPPLPAPTAKSVAAKVLGSSSPIRDGDSPSIEASSPTSRDRYPASGNSPGRPVQRFKVFARVDTPLSNDEKDDRAGTDSDMDALGLEYDVMTTQRTRSDSMAKKSSYHANAHLELMSLAASVANERDGTMVVGSAFHQSSMAYTKRRTDTIVDGGGDHVVPQEELTEKAVAVIHRVVDKLTGLDFHQGGGEAVALPIPEQIDHLIKQATSNENLSTCFIGWCAFW